MLRDQARESEALIQLADEQQARVRRHARSLEVDLQESVECELKRLVLFFTHRVSSSIQRFVALARMKIRCNGSSRRYGTTGKSEIRAIDSPERWITTGPVIGVWT